MTTCKKSSSRSPTNTIFKVYGVVAFRGVYDLKASPNWATTSPIQPRTIMTKTKQELRALCEGCSGPEMCPVEITAGDVLGLLDEVERLRKDAMRYRHMRDTAVFRDRNGPGLYWYLPRFLRGSAPEQLDESIDAAIQESQP